MDSVELVMSIEEEFAIQIPEADAEKIQSVGNFFEFLIAELQRRVDAASQAEIWNRLQGVIVEQLGVRPEDVIPSAHFVRDLGVD